jgi:alpha-galactosidase
MSTNDPQYGFNPQANRRDFIKLSSLALGGLLFSAGCSGRKSSLMQFPDVLKVVTEESTLALQKHGKIAWGASGVEVKLSHEKNALAIDVEAPKTPLKQIVIEWNIPAPAQGRFFGDHWERGYGDLEWKTLDSERVMPWYFMAFDGQKTSGFGVKTACHSMSYWMVNSQSIKLVLDVRSGGNGVLLGDQVLRAAEIVARQGKENETPFEATTAFCGMMNDKVRIPKLPVYGINDWYYAYGESSHEQILRDTALLSELAENGENRPFSIIDAGWTERSPQKMNNSCFAENYVQPNKKFPNMKLLADKIKELGVRPGIWVRPLCSKIDDPEHVLRPLKASQRIGRILDPTVDENIERVKDYFKLYQEWGYEIVKHDFTAFDIFGFWGNNMGSTLVRDGWNYQNRSITNAEICLNLYREIRKAAGDMYIIGCNTISHLSAGLVELQRTGADTSGNVWKQTLTNGVNTLAFRMPQHNKFYVADADCVGLTTKIPWELNKMWLDLLSESGTPLFISADLKAVGAQQKAALKKAYSLAAQSLPAGVPLDWMESKLPSKWILNGRTVEFDWAKTV